MKRNKQINKILNKIFVYRYICTFVYFITWSYNAKEKKAKNWVEEYSKIYVIISLLRVWEWSHKNQAERYKKTSIH